MELQDKTDQESETKVEPDEGKARAAKFHNIRDPVYRSQLLRWLCVPVAFFSTGIADSLAGTTSYDLQIITSIDKDKADYYFTALSIGYLLGQLLAGILYGRINSYFTAVLTTCLAGITCIGTPYCSMFATMFLMRSAIGFFLGLTNCIFNTEHMQIWGTKGESLLQLINCGYAVGGVVGPLITQLFISDKETDNKKLSHHNSTLSLRTNVTEPVNSTHFLWTPVTGTVNSSLSLWHNVTDPTMSTPSPSTNVHYAYLITGIILIVSTVPSLLTLVTPNTSVLQAKERTLKENGERKLPFKLKVFMVACLFSYCLAYCCVESIFMSFLVTFLENQFDEVTSQQATFTTTFFWASFAFCRFLSIFTSGYLTAVRQLYLHLSLMTFAFSGFLVSALYSRIDILTAFTCIAGLACSAIFPAMISWTEAEIMRVTGPISAVILVGASTGVAITPPAVGYLMNHVSNLWFCYCLMASIVISISHFVFILLFNRCYVNAKYGKLGETRETDKQDNIEIPETGVSQIVEEIQARQH